MNRRLIYLLIVLLTAVAVWFWQSSSSNNTGNQMSEVKVPALSQAALAGELLFEGNCAQCHGKNGAGVDGSGPPLIHKIYEPGHHGDQSFLLAAKRGVRSHHWKFGNMPPVEGVSSNDVAQIVLYIREVQRENGIF